MNTTSAEISKTVGAVLNGTPTPVLNVGSLENERSRGTGYIVTKSNN